jgi:8-hydroxy-5-deazaflavin:NADPH oxidoreductase
MRIAVLGTGMVGQTLATKLVEVGHDVVMGSRDAANEKAAEWVANMGGGGRAATFAEAAEYGEVVVNATSGGATLAALELAGADNLAGKVLVEVANPLDFSQGFPPTLTVANTDSLAEQVQRAYPAARVVKALNTVNASVMVRPGDLAAPTNLFIAGDDDDAKAVVVGILESFGWAAERILDLGDITAARGLEAWLLLWTRMMQKLGTPKFNIAIVTG